MPIDPDVILSLGAPAGAGIDLALLVAPFCRMRFPRRRGDRPKETKRMIRFETVPPQARG